MVVVALPLTISLGLWQLQRAEYKRSLANEHAARQREVPLDCKQLAAAPADTLAYRRLRLEGAFDAQRQFLLDNRTFEGHDGYQVVTPFRCTSGTLLLINRGWLPMPEHDRTAIPPLPVEDRVQVIFATAGVPPARTFDDDADTWAQPWPMRLPGFDAARMQERLGEPVLTWPVWLDAGQPGALAVRPLEADFNPAKHTGYAVQWFAMAAAVVAWFLIATWRRTGDEG